jgi:hypothetical protein
VEEYGLDELVASAEGVLAGLGPLAAGLARLAGAVAGAVTLDEMEVLAWGVAGSCCGGWSSSAWMPRPRRRSGWGGWPARMG